jgi:enamine deaminase RidA (YjgF/YER057c/UK114 family)
MHVVPTPGLPPPTGFSHVWRVGDILYISGQTSFDDQGRLVAAGDIEGQAVRVFENLKIAVESAGGSLRDIFKMNIYATEASHYESIRSVRRRFFGDHWPVSTLVIVRALAAPELLLEIEAMAVARAAPSP